MIGPPDRALRSGPVMGVGPAPGGLICPRCRATVQAPAADAPDLAILTCPRCGLGFRARRRGMAKQAASRPVVGGLGLRVRIIALAFVQSGFYVGTGFLAAMLMGLGGFIPVGRRWLDGGLNGWGTVVEALGGAWPRPSTKDPDADLGPVVTRADAPGLFDLIDEVARGLGAKRPAQVRLTYLPCVGVVAWGRSRALVVGPPLLYVLNRAELRAVLAHELAHLAKGDAQRSSRASRFATGLGGALDRLDAPSLSPLRYWARACRAAADALNGPITLGQEARADRVAAELAGGDAAASALVKVAMVQPLFREVLAHHAPALDAGPNLYATFRSLWDRLPDPLLDAIRHRLLSGLDGPHDPAHPPLLDRLAVVQSYPSRPPTAVDLAPAASTLADAEAMERMLHDRLFGVRTVEPSVFHRAGS